MSEKTTVSADKKSEIKKENSVPLPQKSNSSQFTASPVDRILFLQRTIGNQAVERLMRSGILQAKLKTEQPGDVYEQEADSAAEAVMQMTELHSVSGDTYLQRDEEGALPPVPEFRLTTPSLLEPNATPYPNIHLQVPQLTLTRINDLLDPASVRQALFRIDPGSIQSSSSAATPAPQVPPASGSDPLVPAGPGPETPRPATGGDIIRGLMAVPAIDSALTSIQNQAMDRVRRDYESLNRGEKITAITAVALVGAGGLAGVLSNPDARRSAIGLLNGRTFPVPGVPGLRFELNTQAESWMVGFHLDVGALLPRSLGFGPGSPTPIGGPPTPEK